MNKKNKKVLEEILADPVRAGILWSDIELLLAALGAEITEGNGSRVRIKLNGVRAVFHRPHPEKTNVFDSCLFDWLSLSA